MVDIGIGYTKIGDSKSEIPKSAKVNRNSRENCGQTSFLTYLLKVGKHLLSTPSKFIINKSFETSAVSSSIKLAPGTPKGELGRNPKFSIRGHVRVTSQCIL